MRNSCLNNEPSGIVSSWQHNFEVFFKARNIMTLCINVAFPFGQTMDGHYIKRSISKLKYPSLNVALKKKNGK